MRKKSQKGGVGDGYAVDYLSDEEDGMGSDEEDLSEEEEEANKAAGEEEEKEGAGGEEKKEEGEEEKKKRGPRNLKLSSGMKNKTDSLPPSSWHTSRVAQQEAAARKRRREKRWEMFNRVTQKLKKGPRTIRNGARTLRNRLSKKIKP